MENIIEIFLIVLVSVLIVNELWRMKLAVKREIRNELIDALLIMKLKRELKIEKAEVFKNEKRTKKYN